MDTKVRIVGSKQACQDILKKLEIFYILEAREYNKAPTRYARVTRAKYSIYVIIKKRRALN